MAYEYVTVYSDGACRGNPGRGSIGLVIFDPQNNLIHEFSEVIGETTNNQAEYKALIKALDLCVHYTRAKVNCFLDSDLVVKQVSGKWCIKKNHLKGLFDDVEKKKKRFSEVIFQHVPRENQKLQKADRLANEALEGRPVSREYQNGKLTR